VSRDLMIVGAVMISWVMDKPVTIRPLLVSKLNTAAQIGLAAAVLAAKAFGLPFGLWFTVAIYAVAGLTIASAAAYLTQWIRHMDL
jgi:cardiolipin synthase (CMP-forming)